MKKVLIFFLFLLITITYNLAPVHAVCPVCTVAVGAGLGLARYVGVDDIVSGIWIGGLILSSSFWLSNWLNKKYFSKHPTLKFPFLTSLPREILMKWGHLPLLTSTIMYIIVLLPLWISQTIGHPFNTIFGIDKLIFGTILGSIIFLLAVWADKKIREVKNKQLFVYQKVVLPVFSLIITSLLIYFYINSFKP